MPMLGQYLYPEQVPPPPLTPEEEASLAANAPLVPAGTAPPPTATIQYPTAETSTTQYGAPESAVGYGTQVPVAPAPAAAASPLAVNQGAAPAPQGLLAPPVPEPPPDAMPGSVSSYPEGQPYERTGIAPVGVGYTPERTTAVPGTGGSIGAGQGIGVTQDRMSLVPNQPPPDQRASMYYGGLDSGRGQTRDTDEDVSTSSRGLGTDILRYQPGPPQTYTTRTTPGSPRVEHTLYAEDADRMRRERAAQAAQVAAQGSPTLDWAQGVGGFLGGIGSDMKRDVSSILSSYDPRRPVDTNTAVGLGDIGGFLTTLPGNIGSLDPGDIAPAIGRFNEAAPGMLDPSTWVGTGMVRGGLKAPRGAPTKSLRPVEAIPEPVERPPIVQEAPVPAAVPEPAPGAPGVVGLEPPPARPPAPAPGEPGVVGLEPPAPIPRGVRVEPPPVAVPEPAPGAPGVVGLEPPPARPLPRVEAPVQTPREVTLQPRTVEAPQRLPREVRLVEPRGVPVPETPPATPARTGWGTAEAGAPGPRVNMNPPTVQSQPGRRWGPVGSKWGSPEVGAIPEPVDPLVQKGYVRAADYTPPTKPATTKPVLAGTGSEFLSPGTPGRQATPRGTIAPGTRPPSILRPSLTGKITKGGIGKAIGILGLGAGAIGSAGMYMDDENAGGVKGTKATGGDLAARNRGVPEPGERPGQKEPSTNPQTDDDWKNVTTRSLELAKDYNPDSFMSQTEDVIAEKPEAGVEPTQVRVRKGTDQIVGVYVDGVLVPAGEDMGKEEFEALLLAGDVGTVNERDAIMTTAKDGKATGDAKVPSNGVTPGGGAGGQTANRSSGGGGGYVPSGGSGRYPASGGSGSGGFGNQGGFGGFDFGGGDVGKEYTADDFMTQAGGNRRRAEFMAKAANRRRRSSRTRGAPIGTSGQFWEGFPYNRPPSPIRTQVLGAIEQSKAEGRARKQARQ